MKMQVIDIENEKQSTSILTVSQVPKVGDKVRYDLCWLGQVQWEDHSYIDGTVVSVEWTYAWDHEFATIRIAT